MDRQHRDSGFAEGMLVCLVKLYWGTCRNILRCFKGIPVMIFDFDGYKHSPEVCLTKFSILWSDSAVWVIARTS